MEVEQIETSIDIQDSSTFLTRTPRTNVSQYSESRHQLAKRMRAAWWQPLTLVTTETVDESAEVNPLENS